MNASISSINKVFAKPGILLLAVVFFTVPFSVSRAAKNDMETAAVRVSQVIAHRGASAERPECTLASVARAIAVGATATEVDVRTSKDGRLFILHDATLDRTTNGKGPANALTLAELQRLDAGSHFDSKFSGERIPSLIEVAQLCRGKIDLMLDLKEQGDGYDRQVASVIREHGDPAKTVVGLRSVEQARRFRKLLPEAKQLALIPTVADVEAFAETGVDFIRIWPRWLTEGDGPVRRVRATGVKLHLNGLAGEMQETLGLLVHKPDSLSADDPKKLRETLRRIAAGDISSREAPELSGLKAEAADRIDDLAKLNQEIIDSLFSYSELGFQEFETQRYLTKLLKQNDFEVEQGVSGIPSAWWAKWGSGKPVIALGTDVDCIPKASQLPGVTYREPLIEGAPGHGEGHNSGMAVIITAALAVKDLMVREGLPGTIVIWPGIAEELLGTKAWYARDGLYKDVDAVLFTHVSNNMNVSWGNPRGTGLVSVEYTFDGVAAHGAGAPWRGRSALDAVELMNVGWNFRREHLHPLQRSHYVIVDGGDQPNVVPSKASVWYFIREITAEGIRENFATLQKIAEGAAMMTDTTLSRRIVGTAYPRHFNKPIALAMDENIKAVGLPQWSEDDHVFAKALQELMEAKNIEGLATKLSGISEPVENPVSGGSDDIGDVSWNVPTVTLRYPSNVQGMIAHHWSSAMAMATPIAHKGANAGAKVVAATLLDMLQNEQILKDAWTYFNDVQTAEETYEPFITNDDPPAIEKNVEIMAEFKDRLKEYYYDPSKYDTYLEQLGVDYPQLVRP
jgi:aminobenzoyl-glutamate utilization protein B